jgi:hypothetical protein
MSELAGQLSVLEALILATAEQCLTASIKDAGRLEVAFLAINRALAARVAELEQSAHDLRDASQAAWGYREHLAEELRIRLAKHVDAFARAPAEGNA